MERFANENLTLPVLIQAALLHYQFETIHPFLDGNGRLGRLLIVFFLIAKGRLTEPLLYVSGYFEKRRDDYYDALQGVRERGDLDTWLTMFLDAVRAQADDAVLRAEKLLDLRESYRARVQKATRSAAQGLVDLLFEHPVLSARDVERRIGVTRPAALAALRRLEAEGFLSPAAPGARGQLRWRAHEVLEILLTD
ncbi:MAG: hypothetical protein KatS3mg008_1726 [Acidimicrobiales bacterium]|nr:MAG: hypothetical protein KatS3mg008_1726 [Acidimicrobiales bacterium]